MRDGALRNYPIHIMTFLLKAVAIIINVVVVIIIIISSSSSSSIIEKSLFTIQIGTIVHTKRKKTITNRYQT